MKKSFVQPFIILALLFFTAGSRLMGQSLKLIDSLEMALEFAPDDQARIHTLNKLAVQLLTSNTDEAYKYAEEAYALARETGDKQGQLQAIINMGTLSWSRGDYEAAMDMAVRACEAAEDRGSKTMLAQALHLTGLIYTDLGNFTKSSEYFFRDLNLFKAIGDQEGVSKTLNTIGVIHFEQKNYSKALDYFFNSLNLAREIGYDDGIARGLNNMAIVFENRKEYAKAATYFLEAVAFNQRLGHAKGEGINYLNLGIVHESLNAHDSALMYFNRALAIFRRLENNLLIAKTNNYIGEYYFDLGDSQRTRQFALRALEEGRSIHSKMILHSAASLLHRLSLSESDTSSAYRWAMLQNRMQDSLNLEESNTELSKLELLNAFNEREREQKIKKQRRDFIILIVIMVLLFTLVVILLVYARQVTRARAVRAEKEHLKDTLEFRNKELTANVLYLMKKNELLSKISAQLLELEKEAVKDETKAALHRIAREVKKNKETDVWTEFELRFNQVHENFYRQLTEKFPELTASDLRLCAFLKLNLTSKEISQITGQRVGTIEMARSRLRKKFGINNTPVDIVTFLSRF